MAVHTGRSARVSVGGRAVSKLRTDDPLVQKGEKSMPSKKKTDPHVLQRPPVIVRDGQGRIRMRDDTEKKRVLSIATTLVLSRMEKGEVDPDDEEDVKKATREAIEVAVVTYRAAIEFIRG